MRVRIAREQAPRIDDALAALLPVEPYLAYSNFRPIARREGALFALHQQRVRAAAAGLGVLVARDERDHPLALVCLEHREFDSRHFGTAMAKIEPPAAVPDEQIRFRVLREIYRAACDLLRAGGYQHLSAVSSTLDRVACWVLQEIGAFHVGTKISWMQPLTGRGCVPDLPAPLRVEVYDRSTIRALSPDSWRRLDEWSGKAFDRGPFVFDWNVSHDRALAVYQVWTQRALTGEFADAVLVVRDREEIVAFHSMMRLADLSEAAGVGILGRGIGGTLPGYHGLFTALQRSCAAVRPLGADFLENETQASTLPCINVFGKLGHYCVRSTASFHMRLDGGGSGRHPAHAANGTGI